MAPVFWVAGDIHSHFFGKATLKRSAEVVTQPGYVFEISTAGFGHLPHPPSILPLGTEISRSVIG